MAKRNHGDIVMLGIRLENLVQNLKDGPMEVTPESEVLPAVLIQPFSQSLKEHPMVDRTARRSPASSRRRHSASRKAGLSLRAPDREDNPPKNKTQASRPRCAKDRPAAPSRGKYRITG